MLLLHQGLRFQNINFQRCIFEVHIPLQSTIKVRYKHNNTNATQLIKTYFSTQTFTLSSNGCRKRIDISFTTSVTKCMFFIWYKSENARNICFDRYGVLLIIFSYPCYFCIIMHSIFYISVLRKCTFSFVRTVIFFGLESVN